ncbi:uncharacterized protein KQ657_004186 [Scheffersomyces spartinae]|uniref:RNase III domain-containing protein n=1 Tax=Scheffersomyces spartinae TaxID=45513 RepID=A0A9P7VBX8_9ASCO|nr:uncharacterized protein KQ657_004186 [Scheffersomyces spartinae]KAG7195072.1 hypothetical protein KQ657_004186 [Scheffersomyces spartinae]
MRKHHTKARHYSSPGFRRPTTMSDNDNVINSNAPIPNTIVPSLIPAKLDDLLRSNFSRNHLFNLGTDLIKLDLYQKFGHMTSVTGGGFIKTLVHSLSTFVKEEFEPDRTSEAGNRLRELVYLTSNLDLYNEDLRRGEETGILNTHNISDFKWFFIAAGYMLVTSSKAKIVQFTESLAEIYAKARKYENLLTNPENQLQNEQQELLDILNDYYETVEVDESLIHNGPKHITMYYDGDYKVKLPELPTIRNKQLLVKALIHKELYRAFLTPNHPIATKLKHIGYTDLNYRNYMVFRYDLSFLDGLGDFFLEREATNLMYKFKNMAPYNNDVSFGNRTYNMLKRILATNTLLSRLAAAYNLPFALKDTVVHTFLQTYIEKYDHWSTTATQIDEGGIPDDIRYEQEFIADYFEAYVGAVFLEDPDKAQLYVNELYMNILLLIGDKYKERDPCLYKYGNWCTDIIGRKI